VLTSYIERAQNNRRCTRLRHAKAFTCCSHPPPTAHSRVCTAPAALGLWALAAASGTSLFRLAMCVLFYLTCSLVSWAAYYGIITRANALMSPIIGGL
jgi:hypothetical protein